MITEEKRLFYAILPITFVMVLYSLSVGSTVILWVICSFFLFALIDPWMQKFKNKGIHPVFLSIALVFIAFAVCAGFGFLIYKSSSEIITQVISYKDQIFKLYHKANGYLNNLTHTFTSTPSDPAMEHAQHASNATANGAAAGGADAANAATSAANASASANAGASASAGQAAGGAPSSHLPGPMGQGGGGLPDKEVGMGVLSGIGSILSVLTYLVLTPLLTFFIAAERDLFSRVGEKCFKEPGTAGKIWKQITDAITAYFAGNLVIIIGSFPIFVFAFWLIGVKSFLNLGLLSAILNLVPFLGFALAAVLPTLDLLLNGGHAPSVIALVALCLVTHFTIANVVTPKLLGAKLNVNATVSTIALIGWGELWGPLGLLLAIPMMAIIRIGFENSNVVMFQRMAEFMGEDQDANARLRLKQKTNA